MAITTYAELLTAMQNYEDDSSAIVTGVDDDMVTLGEQRIFYGGGDVDDPFYTKPLRVMAMEKTVVLPVGSGQDGGTSTGSANAHVVTVATTPTLVRGLTITFEAGFSNTSATTLNPNALGVLAIRKGRSRDALESGDILLGGQYTVYYDGTYYVLLPSDGAVPIPANFLGVKGAYLQDRSYTLSPMPSTGINIFMRNAVNDTPRYFSVEADCIRLDPRPAQDEKLVLNYYARPPALSTALNDIFREAPGIYLNAALLELAIYLPNETTAPIYFRGLKAALAGYANSDRKTVNSYAPMKIRLPGNVA